MDYPIQIGPVHVDHGSCYKEKYIREQIEKGSMVAQIKYDGERCLIHITPEKVWATSRRISKKTGRYQELQDTMPYLNELRQYVKDYTVLDSEAFAGDWSKTAGILHSLPERAIKLQEEGIFMTNRCFDCLFFNGEDLREKPYQERYQILQDFLKNINNNHIQIVTSEVISDYDSIQEYMNKYINSGNEGVVIKDITKTYYEKGGYLKYKKTETVDVAVYGYQQGNGKYSNTVGALLVGYYDPTTDKIIHVTKVNCGTDADRDEYLNWFKTKQEDEYRVLEVKCQEVTDKSLRHPVFIRTREDKDYKMCTKETIFK